MERQPTLEGERLLLRPLREEDWDALFAVASDPLIWEIHPAHDRWQEPVFRAFFEDALAKGGALAVIDKASGAIIGSSRFQGFDPDTSTVEIGWTFLARSHWGGSYNREMKRLMVAHALRWVHAVHFQVGEDNIRSRTALARIGARDTGQTTVVMLGDRAIPHLTYEITQDSFASGPLAQ